jgi:cell division protein FtsW
MKKIKSRSPLLYYLFFLVSIGLFFISSSTLFEAQSTLGDQYFFLRKQIIWIVIGYFFLLFFSKINLKFLKQFSFYFYLFSLILLLLVLIPGIGDKILGARRWINLGFFNLQPSEIYKLASTIFFSALFSDKEEQTFKKLILFLLPGFFLIVFEPNLSTALLTTAIIVSIYYLSGGPNLPIFFTFFLIAFLGAIFVAFSPYRLARVKTLVNQTSNNDQNYHSQQIIYSLASGGWSGKGIANSDQKYKFLPKISTDSILAIIGEETGFIGLAGLTFIFLLLVSYIFKLSQILLDPFEKLFCGGFACWISYQAMINFSAIVSLIPLTGIPFPFVSYGGSSLLTLFIGIGLIRNIEKREAKLLYSKSDQKKNPHHRNSHYSRH